MRKWQAQAEARRTRSADGSGKRFADMSTETWFAKENGKKRDMNVYLRQYYREKERDRTEPGTLSFLLLIVT